MSLVSNPVLGVNLRKNRNSKSLAFGKYYAEVDRQKTLNIRGFAEHMISHGCVYDRGDIESILIKVTECLPELVAQGIPIQLGDPSGPAFKDRCTLELRNVIDEVEIGGEKYKKLVPIDTYVAEHQVTP